MNINWQQANFIKSVTKQADLNDDLGAEIAFAGRSNAGKSSAINTITARPALARKSKTPGRTQAINFFGIEDAYRFADLPGYGYANVSHQMQKEWQELLEHYLETRKSLKGLCLIMDVRHPLKDTDWQLINWAKVACMPVHILLTKADKLNKQQANKALLEVQTALRNYLSISIQLFSSQDKRGVEEARNILTQMLGFVDNSLS